MYEEINNQDGTKTLKWNNEILFKLYINREQEKERTTN